MDDITKALAQHRTNQALEQLEYNPNQARSAFNCRLNSAYFE